MGFHWEYNVFFFFYGIQWEYHVNFFNQIDQP
jgi:hypothetical protein